MILDEILEILKKENINNAYTVDGMTNTYKEFYRLVANIYHHLLIENPKKDAVVVYGHKEVYMKATFLACSFAGIPYVPIDISIPEERVQNILEQIKPALIVGDLANALYQTINKEQIEKIMNQKDFKEIDEIYMKEEDVYYVIFTSGTTGIPKGVAVTYKNLNSCIKWLKQITKIEKGVILNQAVFSFDLSVADLYLSLISGSEHYILENKINQDFKTLFENLRKSNATMAVMTPSFAEMLMLDKSFSDKLLPNLKTILFCGEKLSVTTAKKLYERFKNINIINSYGPTECTFAVTSINITKNLLEQCELPIGIPKGDVEIIIVDENKKKLEEGQIGEILIIGESVAKGYLGQANSDAFISYEGKKAYLTGDLGVVEKGNIYCKGRKDKQIKYKGYRIELTDIENNIYGLNYVEKAVVLAKRLENNQIIKLIAFIKLKENCNKTAENIKNELLSKIPAYMCPNIKIINEFPVNRNGKCDEKKLLEEY